MQLRSKVGFCPLYLIGEIPPTALGSKKCVRSIYTGITGLFIFISAGETKMQFIIKLFILLVPVIVFLFYFSHTKNNLISILADFFLLIIMIIFIFYIGKETYANYHAPKYPNTFMIDKNSSANKIHLWLVLE